ncbi:MAG: mannonate dehydratase [Enterococcus sp.]
MNLAFRWYGEADTIPLEYIRQIPNMKEIVSAVYDVPVGDVWSVATIRQLKKQIVAAKMVFETVESVPIHEDIKLGKANRMTYIENYKQTLRNLAQEGIKTVCYNFMPVFDWTRTNLTYPNFDGSTALALSQAELKQLESNRSIISLPGWDESYQLEQLRELLQEYEHVDEARLWENLTYFLQEVLPVAKKVGIQLAIHPDDPPYAILGLPRIITGKKSYEKLFAIDSSQANGVTFCSGSLGAHPDNDLVEILTYCLQKKRVHFVHLRNIQLHKNLDFEETAHASNYGSIDMVALMKLLKAYDYTGPLRPDHGRMIFGERGRPGYGLFDRALGASYLYGVWEALNKWEERK